MTASSASPRLSGSSAGGLQRRFTFHDENYGEPLLPMPALRVVLRRREDAVLYLLEDGQLPFAFNIAMPSARKLDLRVWRGCLPLGRAAGMELDEVLEDILPPAAFPNVKIITVAERFVCGTDHICHLIEAGLLEEVETEGRKVTNARRIARASVAEFLKRRRIT